MNNKELEGDGMNNIEFETLSQYQDESQCASCCDGWDRYFVPTLQNELKRIGFMDKNDDECKRNE
ncbi:hypothetical protein NZD89_20615 [Alicyclobacillus fastidiosus]|uniref:Uncharacterized protein n=1 Tax=Alicyclobacillus fastidiosus TaxID=392011 RepID=A0ABY6ZDP0_9BACL|nr:hypothetical protein [Alicyclobacillus fastidiosus]WAH40683.1 hypothetical protein NZD89_20615 [Alicyclobacillus fastidiosus]GMA62149.1 hypothetical protein GCM10025859_25890 [Alicyclobacillus fastidiosus]